MYCFCDLRLVSLSIYCIIINAVIRISLFDLKIKINPRGDIDAKKLMNVGQVN